MKLRIYALRMALACPRSSMAIASARTSTRGFPRRSIRVPGARSAADRLNAPCAMAALTRRRAAFHCRGASNGCDCGRSKTSRLHPPTVRWVMAQLDPAAVPQTRSRSRDPRIARQSCSSSTRAAAISAASADAFVDGFQHVHLVDFLARRGQVRLHAASVFGQALRAHAAARPSRLRSSLAAMASCSVETEPEKTW